MPVESLNLRVQLRIGAKFAATAIGDYLAADGLATFYFGNIFRARPVASFSEYIRPEQFQGFTDRLVIVYRHDNLIHTFNALQYFFSILGRPKYKPLFSEQEIIVV